MKLFRKLAINVHSRVEAVADRIENKEALSTAYIREYERVVAKAKIRTAQVESEVVRLQTETARQQAEVEKWATRARGIHRTDEAKALACIERMTQAQEIHRHLQKELEEATGLKRKMAGDMESILNKLEALKRKHQNLVGRQACAEAIQVMQSTDGGIHHDIDDLFARWETDVVAHELHSPVSPVSSDDTLAEEFDAEEKKRALRLALETVIANPTLTEEKNNDN